MADIKDAIRSWLLKNCTGEADVFTRMQMLLEHFFYLADCLYDALKGEPIRVVGSAGWGKGIAIGGKHNACIVNRLLGPDFFRLRGMLALVGDMYCVVKGMKYLSRRLDTESLYSVLDSHEHHLMRYRQARNYFAHLDRRIGEGMGKHGVTGRLEVRELGVEFLDEAEGCFYSGYTRDTVYFHDKQPGEAKASAKSLSFSRQGMSDLFSLIRDLYDLVTSDTVHAQDYPPSAIVYDLG